MNRCIVPGCPRLTATAFCGEHARKVPSVLRKRIAVASAELECGAPGATLRLLCAKNDAVAALKGGKR